MEDHLNAIEDVQNIDTTMSASPRTNLFRVKVEKLRLIAYIAFWFMCFFAMTITSVAVAPYLGPCPKTEGAEPTYGLHCSVLVENFGFNNVRLFYLSTFSQVIA